MSKLAIKIHLLFLLYTAPFSNFYTNWQKYLLNSNLSLTLLYFKMYSMSDFFNWLTVSSLIFFCKLRNYSRLTSLRTGIVSCIFSQNSGYSSISPKRTLTKFLFIFFEFLKYFQISAIYFPCLPSGKLTQDFKVTAKFFSKFGLHYFDEDSC